MNNESKTKIYNALKSIWDKHGTEPVPTATWNSTLEAFKTNRAIPTLLSDAKLITRPTRGFIALKRKPSMLWGDTIGQKMREREANRPTREPRTNIVINKTQSFTDEDAVTQLKANGYKVFKHVTELKEI